MDGKELVQWGLSLAPIVVVIWKSSSLATRLEALARDVATLTAQAHDKKLALLEAELKHTNDRIDRGDARLHALEERVLKEVTAGHRAHGPLGPDAT